MQVAPYNGPTPDLRRAGPAPDPHWTCIGPFPSFRFDDVLVGLKEVFGVNRYFVVAWICYSLINFQFARRALLYVV
ncbi:hypothetical protein TL16_g00855 [Triparma laevis f. inornata]|uniref:Uncharacterized protein n=1 Tax=Triparma laevis f. inornata TaxID=1714386 RepID=A0A9W7DPQ4_9STRA|nr:hypothetical protein TL16_g00855 [Triparma laevis f. inornata]